MLQKELIEEFLTHDEIGVVGVSRTGDLPANLIYRKLRKAGYVPYAVNPYTQVVEDAHCYPSVTDLPDTVKAVVLAGPPEVSVSTLDDCAKAGIEIVWIHRGMGSGSFHPEAEARAKDLGIKAITNGCPMMFIPEVDLFHKVFRWIKS